jgi:hypothetical protein
MSDGDDNLIVQVLFDDLRLVIIHEGRSGDLALLQGTLMNIPGRWRELIAETFTITHAEHAED